MKNKQQKNKRFQFERLEERRVMTTFYVDGVGGDGLAGGGDDSNNGTSVSTPFLTIQAAADAANDGDTILIRGGTYREQVDISDGGSALFGRITFAAFDELGAPEDVTITATDVLTGFDPVAGRPNVFVASLAGSTTNSLLNRHELTVFVDGQLVQEASSNNGADYLDIDTWDTFESATTTTIQDNALIGSTDDIVGGFVRVRVNNFLIQDRRISAFNSATGTITLASPLSGTPSTGVNSTPRYLIHDALDLVDSAGEWYFEEETNQFYLFAPGGGDPDNALVEVTRRAEAFDTNSFDFLEFRNLNLQGGDFDLAGSNNLIIDNVDIVASDRIFGPDFGTTRVAINFTGDNNVLRNSEIEQIWSAAVRISGSNNLVANNYIHDTAFNGGGSGGVATTAAGSENVISHNTFARSGRAHIVGPGLRNIIQNNDFSEIGFITEDVGALYFNGENLGNTIVRHNVFHNISGRFNAAVYTDNDVGDLVVHNNIIFDTIPNLPAGDVQTFGGIINTPNTFINWFNNTVFETGIISTFGPGSSFGSRANNNIVSGFVQGLFTGPNPLIAEGNFDYNAPGAGGASNFVNAAAGDFRLTATSGARDAGVPIPGITPEGDSAPDAGALQFGEQIFDFGHDFAAPPDFSELQFDLENFQRVFFSNAIDNGSFERGLEGFQTLAGTPTLIEESTENFVFSVPLGIDGTNSVQLNPGDAIQQTITGLQPNTTYTVTASSRIVGPVLQAEDGLSSGAPVINNRGDLVRGPLQNGDQVVFSDIDFGNDLFDTLQVGLAQAGPGTTIEVFLDNTLGSPISTFSAVSPNNPVLTFLSETSLPTITGTHDLIIRFSGSGSNLGLFDEIRLLDSTTTERTLLGVDGLEGSSDPLTQGIGSVGQTGVRERLEFRTGPNDTSIDIFLQNPSGATFDAFVDGITLAESTNEQPVTIDINQTVFDYDLGVAFQPEVLNTFDLLTTAVSGDIVWTGAVGAFDGGAQAGINAANQDFIFGTEPATLSHRLQNGRWRVALNTSSPFTDHDNIVVRAEGEIAAQDIDRAAGQFMTFTFDVDVTDGVLDLEFSDADTVNPEWTVGRISLERLGSIPAVVDTTQTEYLYDFGTETSPIFDSTFERITATTTGDIFWTGAVTSIDRGAAPGINDFNRDFVGSTSGNSATLEHVLANGIYEVFVNIGDSDNVRDDIGVRAEGQTVLSDIDRAAGTFFPTESFQVEVLDGRLSLEFFDAGGVNNDWSVTRLIINRIGDVPVALGDFNVDQMIDGADLTQFLGDFGLNGDSDANGDGLSNGFDFLAWQQNFGVGVTTTTELIGANTLNGSFEDHTGSTGLAVNQAEQEAFSVGGTPATLTDGIDVSQPFWTLLTVGGVGGFEARDANVASDGTAYAFTNGGVDATITSGEVSSHVTALGDVFTLQFDVGSSNGTQQDYTARLSLGGTVRELGSQSNTNQVSGSPSEALTTLTFSYTATAADVGLSPSIEIFLENNFSSSTSYIDNVVLSVSTTGGLPGAAVAASSAATSAASATAAEPNSLPTQVPAVAAAQAPAEVVATSTASLPSGLQQLSQPISQTEDTTSVVELAFQSEEFSLAASASSEVPELSGFSADLAVSLESIDTEGSTDDEHQELVDSAFESLGEFRV